MASRDVRRVAIVGAGSAGLAAALELITLSASNNAGEHQTEVDFEPVIFERRPHLGGIWQFDADPGECHFVFDERGAAHPVSSLVAEGRQAWPPGPMYAGLRTNIPRDLMCFRDYPDSQHSQEEGQLFPPREQVQSYLESFAKHHDLERFVRYDTDVTSIRRTAFNPSSDGSSSKWSVTSRTSSNKEPVTEEYDHVFMASGRCNRPKVPRIPGLWLWKGKLLHSAWYRTPLVFRGQNVLIVGNNSSGMDVARELNGGIVRDLEGGPEWIADAKAVPPRTGVRVRQSVEDVEKPPPMDFDPRDEDSPAWCRAIEVVPRISRIESATASSSASNGRIVLENGAVLDDVDIIIFATGFSYEFPPLDQTDAPFDAHPILPPAPQAHLSAAEEAALTERRAQHDPALRNLTLPPSSPFMSNLDDWQLFYRYDRSLAFLGIPTSIVPFPFAQIQARYAAYLWAGLVEPLPDLDPDIPVTDERKWASAIPRIKGAEEGEAKSQQGPVQHLFSHPSESAYLDQLRRRLRGRVEYSPVDQLETDGKGGGVSVRGPEGNFQTTKWRRERRANGKPLRRAELGY